MIDVRHPVKYSLATYKEAKSLADVITSRFGAECKVSRDAQGRHRLSTRLKFSEEMALLSEQNALTATRAGSIWTWQETMFLIDQYQNWHTPQSIAKTLRRSADAVFDRLKTMGLWWEPGRLIGSAELAEFPLSISDEYIEIRYCERLAELGIISSPKSGQINCALSELKEVLPPTDVEHLISHSYHWPEQEDSYRVASQLAVEAGLSDAAYYIFRQLDRNPREVFRNLRRRTALGSQMLYDREVLRAHLGTHLVRTYPSIFIEYFSTSNSCKGNFLSACPSTDSLYAYGIQEFRHKSDLATACACASNRTELISLANIGNKIAAAIVARAYDLEILSGGTYRGWDAEMMERVRGDYAPSLEEIEVSLTTAVEANRYYAELLSHLQFEPRVAA